MARVLCEYDGVSLQTNNIITQEFEHESIDSKTLDIQRLASRDGGKLLAATFSPKIIRLRGQIRDTSQGGLEDRIDDFKQLLNRQGKHLDIEFGSGTGKQSRRRYTSDLSRITLLRRHWHVTFADWEAEFVVNRNPFGKELDTSTTECDSIESVATAVCYYTPTGTYPPLPLIIITFVECAGIDGVVVRNLATGDWIEVNSANEFANGTVIRIDCNNYTVTLNDVAWDYSGFFPQFVVDKSNTLRISVKGDGALHYKMNVRLIYYPFYL